MGGINDGVDRGSGTNYEIGYTNSCRSVGLRATSERSGLIILGAFLKSEADVILLGQEVRRSHASEDMMLADGQFDATAMASCAVFLAAAAAKLITAAQHSPSPSLARWRNSSSPQNVSATFFGKGTERETEEEREEQEGKPRFSVKSPAPPPSPAMDSCRCHVLPTKIAATEKAAAANKLSSFWRQGRKRENRPTQQDTPEIN